MSRIGILALASLLTLVSGCDFFRSPDERVEQAAALIENGDYETASIELRNALQKDPENARGRLLLARTAFWMGDVAAAAKELERAVEAGASSVDTAVLDADIKRALGKFKELEDTMNAKPAGLGESERLTYLGYAQLGQGRAADALASFDAAVKVAPEGALGVKARQAQADGLAASGDVAAAMTAVDALLTADPTNDRASIFKARLLLQRGDYAAAEQLLAGLKLGEKNARLNLAERVSALGALAEVQLGQGKPDAAAQTISQLQSLAPNAIAVPYLKGRVALARDDAPEAVTQLQTAVRGAPGLVPARMMLGVALLRQGSVAQAEAEFRKVLEDSPDNVEARKLLAESQLRQGRAAEATAVLQPALVADSTDPRVYALAGQAKLLEGDRTQGEAYLERSVAESSEDPRVRLELAGSYLSAGDTKRALELLATVPDDVGGDTKKQVQLLALAMGKDQGVAKLEVEALVKRNPGDVRLLNLAAGWLEYRSDFDGARAYLNQALAAQPKDVRTLVNLGRLEFKAKRPAEARKAFEAAVAIDPTLADAYLGLTLLAEREGDDAQATKWVEAWRKGDPKAAPPRLLLARRAFAAKKPADGRKLVEEAVKASGGSAPAEGAAGQVLLEAGFYDEALGHFRNAMSADPRKPVYPFGAARAQLALKQREAARESLNRALTLDPNWLPAAALLAQVELGDNRPEAARVIAQRLQKTPATAAAGHALEGDVLMAMAQPAQAAEAYAASSRVRPTAEAAVGESRARQAASLPRPVQPLVDWLARNPGDARVRFVLAQSYEQSGDSAAAAREYEQVIEQQPDNVLALNNLAWTYAQKSDPRAEALAKRAYDKAPQAAAIADTYGWILVQAGRVEEGLKILKQAHDSDKENAEIGYHLGVALLRAGQRAEARQALESAIAAGKDAPWVPDARKLVADLQ